MDTKLDKLKTYHISKIFRYIYLAFATAFSLAYNSTIMGIINYVLCYSFYVLWYIVEWKDLRVTRKELKD